MLFRFLGEREGFKPKRPTTLGKIEYSALIPPGRVQWVWRKFRSPAYPEGYLTNTLKFSHQKTEQNSRAGFLRSSSSKGCLWPVRVAERVSAKKCKKRSFYQDFLRTLFGYIHLYIHLAAPAPLRTSDIHRSSFRVLALAHSSQKWKSILPFLGNPR